MSGRVTFRISLQPSCPSKSSRRDVAGLQHRAHRPVGDHHPLGRGRTSSGRVRELGRPGGVRHRRPYSRATRLAAPAAAGHPGHPASVPGHVAWVTRVGGGHGRRWRVIELNGVGKLISPAVIAAFEGWNDAGEAASGVVGSPGHGLGGHPDRRHRPGGLLRLPGDPAGDGGVRGPDRPAGLADHPAVRGHGPEGMGRDVSWCTASSPTCAGGRSATSWCSRSPIWARRLVVLLGALLADSPHTRPVPVAAAASDPELAAELHVEPVDYKGPTGIVGVLQHACAAGGHRDGVAVGRRAALRGPAAQPQGHAGPAPRRRGHPGRVAAARRPAARRRGPGSAAWTSWPSRTPRWPTTCAPWRRPRTRPTCPRRAATRSPASSSATCAAAATRASPATLR